MTNITRVCGTHTPVYTGTYIYIYAMAIYIIYIYTCNTLNRVSQGTENWREHKVEWRSDGNTFFTGWLKGICLQKTIVCTMLGPEKGSLHPILGMVG